MAEGKKSFLFYTNWGNTFDELSDEDAGKLIKHICDYVRDKNPKTESILIRAVFANIKSILKMDLDKWEAKSLKNSENAKKRWDKKDANGCERIKTNANHADIVNDIDNVIVNDTVIDNEKVINEWIVLNCNGFSEELKQWIEIIETKHNNQTSIIQLESWLRLLNGWYKTNEHKKECLNKHIAGPWKTLNFVKVEELNSTYKKQTSKDFEL